MKAEHAAEKINENLLHHVTELYLRLIDDIHQVGQSDKTRPEPDDHAKDEYEGSHV